MSIEAMKRVVEAFDALPPDHPARYANLQINALRTAISQQPATPEPVLTVEKEPDYWSGGHFYEGSKPHINPMKVWSLPIGTKLYTHPVRGVLDDVVRDAERWRALVESGCELVRSRKGSRMLWAVRPCFTSYEYELFEAPEQAIDAMLAAKDKP